MAQSKATWDDLAELNKERMLALGIPLERHTTEVCLMQMMASIGELSNLAFRTGVHSEFEQEEIEDILGSIALALATVGEVNGVNVGDAAIRKASSHIHRANSRPHASPPTTTPKRSSFQKPPAIDVPRRESPAARPQPEPQQPQHQPPVHTNPPPVVVDGGDLTPTSKSAAIQGTDLLLSPKTNDNFFPMLDIVERAKPVEKDFENLGLKFCVPYKGRMINLVPNGSEVEVTHSEWNRFLELAKPYRPASFDDNDAPPMKPSPHSQTIGAADGTPNRPVATQHIEVHAPAGYDAEKVGALFSPNHFDMDLFSPHTKNKEFNVPLYSNGTGGPGCQPPTAPGPANPEAEAQSSSIHAPPPCLTSPSLGASAPPVAMPSFGSSVTTPQAPPPSMTSVPNNSSGLMNSVTNPGAPPPSMTSMPGMANSVTTPGAPPPSLTSPPGGSDLLQQAQAKSSNQPSPNQNSAKPEAQFWSKIAMIQKKEIQGPSIAALGLTYSIPHNGNVVELIPSGEQIKVTHTNVDAFLDLVRDKVNELEGRLHRSLSIKTLAVSNLNKYNPKQEAGLYSPTHFALDLFAPHTQKTTFAVDYEGESALPPNLRQRETVELLPTANHYVEYVSKGRQYFEDIFAQVKRDAEALNRFQVTFCAIDPISGSLVDLVPNGRASLVKPNDHERYVELVDKLYINCGE